MEEPTPAELSSDDAPNGEIKLTKLLVATGLADNQRDARRLISQLPVFVDAERHKDIDAVITVRTGTTIRVAGRQPVRVVVS